MVTRSRSQNSKLVEQIMDLGGNPIEIPTIKIEKVQDNKELENEIKNIKDYTYLVLTSKDVYKRQTYNNSKLYDKDFKHEYRK